MLHVGEDPSREDALSRRLDVVYDALMAKSKRHFGRERDGYALSGVAGLDTPTMNRAVVRDAPAERAEEAVGEAAGFFGERRAPWSVVLSRGGDPGWHAQLLARGFTLSSSLDVLARSPGVVADAPPDALVRDVREDEMSLFTDLLIEVFHMPRRFYPALHEMSESWRAAGARLYFAEVDGEPVATALLVTLDGVAGIYNVGTRRGARRQGLARALMARAFEDAREADVLTLQVTPGSIAEAFYARLGFERLHVWRYYVPRTAPLMTR